MKSIDIELEIRSTVQLFGKAASGWEKCLHTTCDHGKKGPRSAFLFNTNEVLFNCFNCGVKAGLDLNGKSIPKKFRTVLEDFGMPKSTIDEISLHLLTQDDVIGNGSTGTKPKKPKSITPKPIDLPKDFVLLDGNEDTLVGQLALAELERRKIKPEDYDFLICIKAASKARKKWENRLVIPTMRGNDLIFYQAQDLTKKAEAKYLNASGSNVDRSKIISNYDVLFEKTEEPIYVVEGWYDAYHINGVAVFGNQIKDNQVHWLNKSYRDKVYIPDRYGDGSEIALECLERGWKVSVPYNNNIDNKVKDISDMVATYGILFTMKQIRENISTSDFDAKTKIAHLTK